VDDYQSQAVCHRMGSFACLTVFLCQLTCNGLQSAGLPCIELKITELKLTLKNFVFDAVDVGPRALAPALGPDVAFHFRVSKVDLPPAVQVRHAGLSGV
jgi:hypothetical protein